jgi:hypothetical protein
MAPVVTSTGFEAQAMLNAEKTPARISFTAVNTRGSEMVKYGT